MTAFLVFWAMVALVGTTTGLLAYFTAPTHYHATVAARVMVGSLLAPLVLPVLLAWGVYRLVREIPHIIRATEWVRRP